MRLTIVAEDCAVGVDGEFFSGFELSVLDPNIHAVQWYGDYGEVEFKTRFENGTFVKPANQTITTVEAYQFAIDAWNVVKTDAIAAEAAAAAEIAAAIAAAQAETAAQTNPQSEPVQNDGV